MRATRTAINSRKLPLPGFYSGRSDRLEQAGDKFRLLEVAKAAVRPADPAQVHCRARSPRQLAKIPRRLQPCLGRWGNTWRCRRSLMGRTSGDRGRTTFLRDSMAWRQPSLSYPPCWRKIPKALPRHPMTWSSVQAKAPRPQQSRASGGLGSRSYP